MTPRRVTFMQRQTTDPRYGSRWVEVRSRDGCAVCDLCVKRDDPWTVTLRVAVETTACVQCRRAPGEAVPAPWTPATPAALCGVCGRDPACEGIDPPGRCVRCARLSRELA